MLENLGIVIPKNVENLQLPDPDLLHQYEDEEARRIYLEGAIGTEDDPMNDNSIGIVKRTKYQEATEAFLKFIKSDEGKAIFEKYGFATKF